MPPILLFNHIKQIAPFVNKVFLIAANKIKLVVSKITNNSKQFDIVDTFIFICQFFSDGKYLLINNKEKKHTQGYKKDA